MGISLAMSNNDWYLYVGNSSSAFYNLIFFFNIKSNENEKCTSFSMIFLSSLTTKRPTKSDEKHYFSHTFTKSCHDIEINKHHLSSDVIFRLSNLAEAFQPPSSPFS